MGLVVLTGFLADRARFDGPIAISIANSAVFTVKLSNCPNMRKSPRNCVDVLELVSAALSASKSAAGIVRQVFEKNDLQAVDKAGGSSKDLQDPQTIADTNAQRLIVGSLRNTFKGLEIIGEEGDLEISPSDTVPLNIGSLKVEQYESILSDTQRYLEKSQIVLWIDPLDGTKDFIKGDVEAVTILIGIAYKGEPIAGIIEQPFGQQLSVWGLRGLGAFGFDRVKNREGLCILTSKSHFSKETADFIQSIQPIRHIRMGGAGGKVLFLLQGKGDLYVHPGAGTKKWDSCACDAVLRVCGGMLTNRYGEALKYHKEVGHMNRFGIIASLGIDHEKYLMKK